MLREPSKFGAWLCRIATSAARSDVRGRRYIVPLDGAAACLHEAQRGSQMTPESSDRSAAVRDALAVLPETDRLTVILHYIGGYSHEEIGRMLGLTIPAVKSRIHRARGRVKEEMLTMMASSLDRRNLAVELTEDLVRASVSRMTPDAAILLPVVPAALDYTERTREAVLTVVRELADEGCRWLVAVPHIPDGSPALGLFRDMGFQTEMEMHWYQRSLKSKLPAVTPLAPGVSVRPFSDADPAEVLSLARRTFMRHAPEAEEEGDIRRHQQDSNLAAEASLAAYVNGKLAAFTVIFSVNEENPKHELGTASVWWRTYDPEIGSLALMEQLLAAGLPPLRNAGLRTVVHEQLRPGADEEVMAVLRRLGFRYVRSQWNLKLDLESVGQVGAVERAGGSVAERPAAEMRRLQYSIADQEGCPESLQIRIREVIGTSPVIAIGETYMVSGEYTLAEPTIAALALSCDSTSTGFRQSLGAGTHDFGVSAKVRKMTPGKESTLRLNLMDGARQATVCVEVRIAGWCAAG
jgi:predicted transcriptional regulator